jgi:TatD DNase family protein
VADFIDSHVHLADPAFDGDRDGVIERARVTGARALVCIGESLDAASRAAEISRRFPGFVYWTAGVHPHDAADFDAVGDVAGIRAQLARGAVAIGECGLDYHYDHCPRSRQRRAFAEQLALAGEWNRPVVVHTREAVDDTSAMVREAGDAGIRGVLHCFTGPRSLADVALAAGWYVSFSGVVTFKKWDGDALIAAIPKDRVLVETDAPFLAPVPHRGKRNEPSYASLTLARIAAARGESADEAGRLVTANAARLFGLAIPDA